MAGEGPSISTLTLSGKGDADSLLKLGIMMVKGEGGAMDVTLGRSLWEQAAAKGQEKAQENLDKLDRVVKATVFSV